MTDITQRLRRDKWHVTAVDCEEAADEIEQLRSYLDALTTRCVEDTAEIGRLRDVLSTLCNRIELESATPLDWPAFRAARAALGE